MNYLPTLSVVIVAKNAEKTLGECLTRIKQQSYPKSLIEILVIDGGSSDKTSSIAEKFNVILIDGGYPDNQEARRYIGGLAAKGEILVFLDTDNYLPHDRWLSTMVRPLADKTIVGSFTKWYGFEDGMATIDKYYALIGGNDPICFYLNKNDRVPIGCKYLPRGSRLVKTSSTEEYIIFDHKNLPVIGCNGFLMRATYLLGLAYESPEKFFHIDCHVDIIKRFPSTQYVIVSDVIVHAAGGTIWSNIKKRLLYKRKHSEELNGYRSYKVYDPSRTGDTIKLIFIVLIGLTLIEPTIRAIVGYGRTRQLAWLYHPILTFSMVWAYAFGVIRSPFVR